jgi:YhgE/Pip-like protein
MSRQLITRFLKQPATIIGIITALLFQVFFSLIWITGYDHVTDRVDRLPIAIVNEDGADAQPIAEGIAGSLQFVTKQDFTLKEAQKALEDRKIRMIINIPQGFTGQISNPSAKAELRYLVNESNPQMVSNVMQTVALKVTAAMNTQNSDTALNQTLEAMKLPKAQAEIIKSAASSRISANVEVINPTTNFAQTMVPLMIVTASFTGAMLLAMNLQKASSNLSNTYGKWDRLAARYIVMGGTAMLTSLVGTLMINSLGIHSSHGFLLMWLFEFTIILSCMCLAQLSLLLLGDAGAWLNIALLSMQMLASGATIPRDLLSPFYSWIGPFSPAYYAVNGMLDLVIGGTGVWQNMLYLVCIGAATTILSIMLTFFRKETLHLREQDSLPASA